MSERDLDVVVFGATGVTGRRVAGYLAERAPETGARWAAAARDPAKLERILGEDGISPPETITADLADPGSLREMASRAGVVLNLVGPYTRYGRPVIEACVEAGASYVDLTGEMPFVREVIDEFDAAAREANVKLVHACGFESLPPDMLVALAAEQAGEEEAGALTEVDLEFRLTGRPPGLPRPSDAISGGTLQTIAVIPGTANPSAVTDPAALIVDRERARTVRARSPIRLAPRRGSDGAAIAPMAPAAFINPAVIHRTAELAAEYGAVREPFCYQEGIALPGGPASAPLRFAGAGAMAAIQGTLRAGMHASPAARRRLSGVLTRVLPDSGFGPAADRVEGWRWRIDVRARTARGDEAHVRVDADGHPGYLATARMLGEAGLLLAEEGATPAGAGCMTPAIALGTASAPRFARAGLRFEAA
jgi:short subunit dehydrogenase-like uncharacterized protein